VCRPEGEAQVRGDRGLRLSAQVQRPGTVAQQTGGWPVARWTGPDRVPDDDKWRQRAAASRRRLIVEIIGVIVAGIIIGLLGKFIAPGDKDNIPIWLTVICGIAGVVIGWFVYSAFGGDKTDGVDWVRWIVAILVAAVLVVLASTLTNRNTSSRHV
jgi:uncharacterized membrane protein YeaQ/YmgE (transglycosylase-associated protein family)